MPACEIDTTWTGERVKKATSPAAPDMSAPVLKMSPSMKVARFLRASRASGGGRRSESSSRSSWDICS
jgi:hypothetical protein